MDESEEISRLGEIMRKMYSTPSGGSSQNDTSIDKSNLSSGEGFLTEASSLVDVIKGGVFFKNVEAPTVTQEEVNEAVKVFDFSLLKELL